MAKPILVLPKAGELRIAALRKEPINPGNFGFGLEDWVDLEPEIPPIKASLFLSPFLGSAGIRYSQEREGGDPNQLPKEFKKSFVIGKLIRELVGESRELAEKFGANYFTLVNIAHPCQGYPMEAVFWNNCKFSLEPTSHLYVSK